MRVISGIKKGYKIKAPKGQNTRPTKDRIRESLFNILGNIDDSSIVLDLYAGSGSIGIEFLSRGAKKAYFIDNSHLSIKTIKENLIHTKLESNSEIIKNDAARTIRLFNTRGIKFNYIFMDPPFGEKRVMAILSLLLETNILDEQGLIIIEHEKELILEDTIGKFEKIDYRSYGNECLSFYSKTK